MLLWVDYESQYAQLVDSWLDAEAVAMTGIDNGWDDYWLAVREDAVNYPGCEDFCKVVFENSVPFAAVCFGIYQNNVTISEIVVDPTCRGKGKGSLLLKELTQIVKKLWPDEANHISAVVYSQNLASQKAFRNAGFHFKEKTDDGVDLIFSFPL